MKKKWEVGEDLTNRFFNLTAVSGSGRGPFGKGDGSNEDWIADTKTTEGKSFAVNFQTLKRYQLQAARERKLFFMHVIPIDGEKLVEEDSFIVVSPKTFRALLKNQKETE